MDDEDFEMHLQMCIILSIVFGFMIGCATIMTIIYSGI